MKVVPVGEASLLQDALVAYLRDDETLSKLYKRVARRAGGLAVDSVEVRELVSDVVHDLFTADLPRVAHLALETQIEREALARAKRLRSAGRRAWLIPLDRAPASALIDDVKLGAEEPDPHAVDAASLVHMIRLRAAADAPVLRLLALYKQGTFKRRDILRHGMSASTYRRARERLLSHAIDAAAAINARPNADSGQRTTSSAGGETLDAKAAA